nr:uncharacterized protein LOC109743706 [Aegilops tauschii subsp. strangulata]
MWQSHPELYQIATDTNILVADALRVRPPAISFFRTLEAGEAASWNALVAELEGRSLSQENDAVAWRLTASRKFSVKSLYEKLTEGNELDMARGLWKAGIPLKIKIFMWQMFRNRLPTSDNVAKRNGPANGTCAICALGEDANHVFFGCCLARFAWSAAWAPLGKQRDEGRMTEIMEQIKLCMARSRQQGQHA